MTNARRVIDWLKRSRRPRNCQRRTCYMIHILIDIILPGPNISPVLFCVSQVAHMDNLFATIT